MNERSAETAEGTEKRQLLDQGIRYPSESVEDVTHVIREKRIARAGSA
jgi:predicted 2-oxoglutarate/Fe(II)-dependent dioxygenase YbiX